jgi:phosphatidate cytidylyltransferase
VLWVLVGVFAAMSLGTVARFAFLYGAPPDKRRQRLGSLLAWWVFAIALAAIMLLGRGAALILFCIASLKGLQEFLRLTAPRHEGRGLRTLAFLAVPLQYLWVYLGWQELAWTFIPVFVFLLLPARVILAGKPAGFIEAVTSVAWGLGLVVFCFSHIALFFTLPAGNNPVGGAVGWILFLILLTESHDIAQALWGRRFGRHKLTPTVSPNKTWEGLVLGTLTALMLAVLLAPVLTPLSRPATAGGSSSAALLVRPLLAGLLIAIGGLFADLTMSAVKRDVGVKDTGTLIPGQGGLLDRIDSLTFTTPLFFYFVYFLYG